MATLFDRQTNEREQTLEVEIESVVYQSADQQFTVVRAHDARNDATVYLVGQLGQVAAGETLRAVGRFTEHKEHGKRFKVTSFAPVMPSSRQGVVRYLGSGLIPGIGPALAERLVQKFGDRTLDVIATESGRLVEVSGIGKAKAQAIADAIRSRREEAETLSYLHGLGVGQALGRKLRKKYGADVVRILRDDPYLVAEQIAGVGFKTADAIGQANGFALDDPRRAAGAVLHLVGQAADEGHVFTTAEILEQGANDLGVPRELIPHAVQTLAARNMLVVDGDAIYAPPLYDAERSVAGFLRERSSRRFEVNAAKRSAALTQLASLQLSDAQKRAVESSLSAGVFVLTGGPGTGKTTTVRAIVRAHQALGRRVALAAPTGRAAKRLSEATGAEAKTIHRMLEWNPALGRFARDAQAPLDFEVVLIDESSMIDLLLGASLFAAVGPAAQVILVGDIDQLPPVSPGPLLRELIESEVAPVTRLTEVFRQAQESAIVRGAHAILHGEEPVPTPPKTRGSGDLFVVRQPDAEQLTERLLETLERIKKVYGFDLKRDVQVLTPTRRGPLGTEQLNLTLQDAINPSSGRTSAISFRPGDKVMQLRNDYEREVFNGDLGIVKRVDAGIVYVDFDGREVKYNVDELPSLALAYASTVHKVQGSEFLAVVIVLHASHYMLLSRTLLYTAVTRAKKLAVILSDPRALPRAVRNDEAKRSRCRLRDRLRASE